MRAWRPSHWLGSPRARTAPFRSASPGRPSFRPAVETLEDRVTPAIVGTPLQNYLTQLYQDVTHAPITVGSLAGFTYFLAHGGSVHSWVVQAEANTGHRVFEINAASQELLHHPASAYWMQVGFNVLNGGGTLAQFETLILDSTEFFQQNGSTNDGWLSGVYTNLLGTTPVPSNARSGWDKVFAEGYSRFTVAALIVKGPQKLNIDVTRQFGALLHRAPTAGELATWTAVESASGIDAVIAGLVLLPDYYAYVQAHPPVVPGQTTTQLSLTSSSPTSDLNQTVTFTAQVSPVVDGPYNAVGQVVTFIEDPGTPQSTTLGTPTLDQNGRAHVDVRSLTGGTHTIAATYAGDANFTSSTNSVQQVVAAGATSLAVVSLTPDVQANETVTLHAILSARGAGANVPTGNVTFYEVNGATMTPLDTEPISGFTVDSKPLSLGQGSYVIEAKFMSTTSSFLDSALSPPITQVVKPVTSVQIPTVAVTLAGGTVNPSTLGQTVQFRATVSAPSGGSGTPQGQVIFLDLNGNQLGGPATLNGGVAVSDAVTALPGGTHTILAIYDPQTNNGFDTARGQFTNFTVTPAATQVALAPLAPTPTLGTTVTFTATVTPSSAGPFVPGGTVTFTFNGTDQTPVPVSVDPSGAVTAQFITPVLTGGSYTITATYNKDGTSDPNFATSPASTPVSFTVPAVQTSISVNGISSDSTHGTVGFTAAVSPPSVNGIPLSGTVKFTIDGVVRPAGQFSNGVATISGLALDLNSTHAISASFTPDNANFTPSASTTVHALFQDNDDATVEAPEDEAGVGFDATDKFIFV